MQELSKRMSTQTLDRQIERQMVAEIEKIKKSRPIVEEIEALKTQINVLRKAKNSKAEAFPENNMILKAIRE